MNNGETIAAVDWFSQQNFTASPVILYKYTTFQCFPIDTFSSMFGTFPLDKTLSGELKFQPPRNEPRNRLEDRRKPRRSWEELALRRDTPDKRTAHSGRFARSSSTNWSATATSRVAEYVAARRRDVPARGSQTGKTAIKLAVTTRFYDLSMLMLPGQLEHTVLFSSSSSSSSSSFSRRRTLRRWPLIIFNGLLTHLSSTLSEIVAW